MKYKIFLILGLLLLDICSVSATEEIYKEINIIPTSPEFYNKEVSVWCDGTTCYSSVWGSPNLWGVLNIGNGNIDPNVWGWENLYLTNPEMIGIGNTTMKVTNNGILSTISKWNIKSYPLYNTMSYHEIIYGAKPWGNEPINSPYLELPMKFENTPRLLVNMKYNLYKSDPGNNMAFEAWLFKDNNNDRAPQSGDYEVMVQFYIKGGYPAGSKVGEYSVPILVNGKIVNQTFELYDVTTGLGWRFLTFKSTKNYNNDDIVFDYTKFIEIAENYMGIDLSNHYLMSLEFGSEVYTNNCYQLPYLVDVEWNLSKYSIIVSPRSEDTETVLSSLEYQTNSTGDNTETNTTTDENYNNTSTEEDNITNNTNEDAENTNTTQTENNDTNNSSSTDETDTKENTNAEEDANNTTVNDTENTESGESTVNNSIDVQLNNIWGTGSQYTIKLPNDNSWKLKIVVDDGEITDIWGGKVEGENGNEYIIIPPNYPSSSVGLIISGNKPLIKEAYIIDDNNNILSNWTAPEPTTNNLKINLKIDSDWNTGYVAKIYITNSGNTPVVGWTLKLDTSSKVVNIWGGQIDDIDGNTITVKPASYTNTINPGQTIEVGFQFLKDGSKVYPTILSIN